MPARHRPVATLATVAAAAGVSRQTVSNALNSPELLRPDTLERVQQAIDELGYTPNRAARNLRTRTSHLVGLRLDPAVEGTASGLMDRFLHSLVESCKEAGLHVLLFTAEDVSDPLDGYDALLRSAAVDAFVVTDTYRGNPQAGVARRAAGAVRRLRPALGRAAGGASRGSTSTVAPASARGRPPRRPRAPADRLGRLAEDLVHRRGPAQRLGRPDARARAVHHPAQRARRGHRRVRPPGGARAARQRRPRPPSSASATRSRWASCRRSPTAAGSPARTTSPSSASTTRWPRR